VSMIHVFLLPLRSTHPLVFYSGSHASLWQMTANLRHIVIFFMVSTRKETIRCISHINHSSPQNHYEGQMI
jgi:hypothetical protein